MIHTNEISDWTGVDRWWETFVSSHSIVQTAECTRTLDPQWWTGEWDALDAWWKVHVESRHDQLTELQALLHHLNDLWATSQSRFDKDPLAADWASNSLRTGPLRPNQEENWSQWLAHILRTGPATFSRSVFDQSFDDQPDRVEREVHLVDHTGMDRYADILVFYGDRAVSIEVKKGDEHYEKTTHTARLIESQFNNQWTHYLLVPRRKQLALERSFPDRLDEHTAPPMIRSDQSDDIRVLFWEDISAVLRAVLLTRAYDESHWEASAYLLCTLLEQKISRFVPIPVVDRLVKTTDVVRGASSLSLTEDGIKEQQTYLQAVIENYNHE